MQAAGPTTPATDRVDVDALLSGISSAVAGAISTDDIHLDEAAVSTTSGSRSMASGSRSMASTALGAPAPQQQDVAADASSGSTIRVSKILRVRLIWPTEAERFWQEGQREA